MPESPRWLLRHGRYDQVRKAMAALGAGLAIVFVWKFLPETKGLPVEEIVQLFDRQQRGSGGVKVATVQ
jgi:hypothetical protein